MSYFTIFIAAGVDLHGVRDIAQNPGRARLVVEQAVAARLVLLGVSLVVLGLLVVVLPDQVFGRIDLVLIYALTLVTYTLNTVWALRGLQQMRTIGIGLVVQNLLMAASTFLLVRSPDPQLWLVPAMQVASECFLVGWYYRYLRRRFGPMRPVFDRHLLVPMLKETLHLSLGRFPKIFYFQGDVLLLAALASAAGEFLASHKIILSLVTIGILCHMTVFPTASRLASDSASEALRFEMNVLRYVLLALAPLVAFVAAYAEPLIELIFGAGFRGSAPILFWMAFTVPLFEANLALQDVLVATRKHNAVVAGNVTIMVVHVAAGFWLIPGAGGTGAALACLLGEAVGLLLLAALAWSSIGESPFSLRLLAPVAGAVPVYFFLVSGIGPSAEAARIALGLLLFVTAAAALRALTREEMARILGYLRRPL